MDKNSVDRDYLKQIVDATAAGTNVYVGQVKGQPMVAAGLIEINAAVINPNVPGEVLCRSLPTASAYLEANVNDTKATDKPVYAVITNAVLPPAKKRGNTEGSGAPTKYPFADLPVGGSFFSANEEHKKKDAVKGLGSTVSAQNDKYATQKLEGGVRVTKTVTRAVRDKVTKKAKLNDDGSKVTEIVNLPVKEYSRKFTIRPVVGGQKYGEWTAPADGALIARII